MTITVCPSNRLAIAIARREVEARAKNSETAWLTSQVMPWSAWLETLLNDYVAREGVDVLPLASHQSLKIWTDVVSEDVALDVGGVAELAQKAWQRMHAWMLPDTSEWDPLDTSVDSAQFARWAENYQAILAEHGWVDSEMWLSRLPSLIAQGEIALPDKLIMAGFDLGLTPMQAQIVDAFAAAGVVVESRETSNKPTLPEVTSAEDKDEEIEVAAAWVREQLDAGSARIGLVVTELSSRLDEVDRVLRRVLRPDVARLGRSEELPWHLSLGAPLIRTPLIAQALDILRFEPDGLQTKTFGALLRSPFLGGWEEEQFLRAELDAVLRRLPGQEFSFSLLMDMVDRRGSRLDLLRDFLSAWATHRAEGRVRRSPSSWAQQFSDELGSIGHGAGRLLTSIEFQAWESFRGVMEQFSALDTVSEPISRGAAVGLLTTLCAGRIFREKNPGAPVEVLTPKEALGGEFDALWVVGVDDSSWPAVAQPDPLLPRALQQECPDSTPESQLAIAARTLSALCQTAPRVVMSFATLDGEVPLRLSGLVAGPVKPFTDLVTTRYLAFPTPVPVETIENDSQAPAITTPDVSGGTRVLYNQEACGFRALAEHRLGARSVQEPQNGLDARARGSLLHLALEHFWKHLTGSNALKALSPDDLDLRVKRSVKVAIDSVAEINPLALSPEMKRLEVDRLAARLLDWIAIEKKRPDFTIKSIEEKQTLDAGGLRFQVKLDRVDEVAQGDVLIDYKSGKTKPGDWYPGHFLNDPQLPAYTLTMDKPPVGLVFGKLKPSELGFAGISGPELKMPGVAIMDKCSRGMFKHHESWPALVREWQAGVNRIATDFRNGVAPVAPRHTSVCDYCELKALCRIRQRMEMAA